MRGREYASMFPLPTSGRGTVRGAEVTAGPPRANGSAGTVLARGLSGLTLYCRYMPGREISMCLVASASGLNPKSA